MRILEAGKITPYVNLCHIVRSIRDQEEITAKDMGLCYFPMDTAGTQP